MEFRFAQKKDLDKVFESKYEISLRGAINYLHDWVIRLNFGVSDFSDLLRLGLALPFNVSLVACALKLVEKSLLSKIIISDILG